MEPSKKADPKSPAVRRRSALSLTRWLASRAANLGLLLVSTAATFLVMELLVRALYGSPPHWRVPQVKHRLTSYGYKLVPAQAAFSGGAPTYSNSHGFRGPDWITPKPPGTFRIMVLGDSVSFGNLVPYDVTFAAGLQRLLSRRGPGTEVILTAIGGWDTGLELAFLEAEGIEYEPDVVVLGFFYNDYRPHVDPRTTVHLTPEGRVDERPRWFRWVPYRLVYAVKRSALVAFVRNRIANYQAGLTGKGSPDFFHALMENQVRLDENERIKGVHLKLARMKELCAARGIRLLVVHIPPVNLFWYPKDTRAYISHLERFCREHAISFLDLSDRFWREKDTNALYLYPWDNHLNPRGHAVVAEELAAVLGPWSREGEASASLAPQRLITATKSWNR